MNAFSLRRIRRGLGASLFSQVVNIVVQIAAVPLFIRWWGVELYGEWLVLSSVPAYFALSDVGFGNVAANEMTMLEARGERDEANEVLQSSWLFVTAVSLGVLAIGCLLVAVTPLRSLLALHHIDERTASTVGVILLVHVLVALQMSVVSAVFRAGGHYASAVNFSTVVRVLETLALVAALGLGGGPVRVAGSYLGARALGFLLMFWRSRVLVPWAEWGVSRATRACVRRLFPPAAGFMAYPLGQALTAQGLVVLVGHVLGPTATVVFATTRTLVNAGRQAMAAINNTVWPELSSAYGSRNLSLARALHRHACQASLWIAIAVAGSLAIGGQTIVRLWTKGHVVVPYPFLALLLVGLVVSSMWNASSIVPNATNQHTRLAGAFVAASAGAVILALGLAPRWGLGGVATAMLAADIAMSLIVLRRSLSLVDDAAGSFLTGMFAVPRATTLARLLRS